MGSQAPLPRPSGMDLVLWGCLRQLFGRFTRLEAVARPGDLNHGAVFRENPVAEGNLGAGPLEQGARDKYSQAKAGARTVDLVPVATPRHMGFADTFEQVG